MKQPKQKSMLTRLRLPQYVTCSNIWLVLCLFLAKQIVAKYNGPFPWNMLITFTHAYRPCWLVNAKELCTKQTRSRVCVTHPLAMHKTARCSLILPTKTLVHTRYVQFTYFMGRVYWWLYSYGCVRFLRHHAMKYIDVLYHTLSNRQSCTWSYQFGLGLRKWFFSSSFFCLYYI